MKKQIVLLMLTTALISGCGTQKNNDKINNATTTPIADVDLQETEVNTDDSLELIEKNDETKNEEISVEIEEKEESVEVEEVYKKLYATTSLNIRSGPSTNYDKIGAFHVNEEVEAFDLGNGWSKVKYDTTYGYVSNKYLSNEKVKIEEKKEVKNDNTQNAPKTDVQIVEENNSTSSLVNDIFNAMNAYRAENGLCQLTMSSKLNNVANVRAKEASQYWSHTRPDGRGPETAFYEQGIDGYLGEILAYGVRTGQAFVDVWKASPSHNAAMLNSVFTKVGIATYTDSSGRIYAAAEFLD